MSKLSSFLFTFLVCFYSASELFCQEIYVIEGDSALLYESIGHNSKIIGTIPDGEVVTVLNKDQKDWWLLSYYGDMGFISPRYLIEPEKSVKYSGWGKDDFKTGDIPICNDFIAEFNDSIDNELLIHVGKNADVVVKLHKDSNECIRMVYICAGDSYSITGIPEGIYYLKIAYGKDLRRLVENENCLIKFLADPVYKIGTEKLDFNIVYNPVTVVNGYEYHSWEVPSFELFLDINFKKSDLENFRSSEITEDVFNQ